jgi:hypothetical protein
VPEPDINEPVEKAKARDRWGIALLIGILILGFIGLAAVAIRRGHWTP